MIEVVPIEPWHINILMANPHVNSSEYDDGYGDRVCAGEGYTLIVDGEVRAAAGVFPLWPNVAEGWSLLTPWVRKKPLLLCKSFKKHMDELCDKFIRVQISTDAGFIEAINFAKFLGFTYEGEMLYYSPDGKTHLRFARINEEALWQLQHP